MGRQVGVDLWHDIAPGGGSLRAAIDYLAPCADPAKRWTGEQITPAEPVQLLAILRMAGVAYGDPGHEPLIPAIPESNQVESRHEQLLRPVRP